MRHCYYSGTEAHPVYVDALQAGPPGCAGRLPVVMLHGGCHTGAGYLATPDGREGWAPIFARAGHRVHVVDWPGHGRSPMRSGFAAMSGRAVIDAVARLIDGIGPCILLCHSASGPFAWALAEALPDQVRAILAAAPGAPAELVPVLPDDPVAVNALSADEQAGCPVYCPETGPFFVEPDFISRYWANAPRFPREALAAYAGSIVPESPRLMNERFNIGGRGIGLADPDKVRARPVLIVTGERDPRHPRAVDEATARHLNADFVWLPDRGVTGNGHMLMLEDNSDDIAGLMLGWLGARGL